MAASRRDVLLAVIRKLDFVDSLIFEYYILLASMSTYLRLIKSPMPL